VLLDKRIIGVFHTVNRSELKPELLSIRFIVFLLIISKEKSCKHNGMSKMTLISSQLNFFDAVSLNNKAVSMISAGDNHKAVQLLKRSFNLMKAAGLAAVREQCAGKVSPLLAPSTTAPVVHETVPLPHMHNRRWFLYSKALRFNTENLSVATFLNDFHIFSAVVMFNLALIYHRSALCGNQKSSRTATTLYSLVLQLVGRPKSCSRSLTSMIVKLAATNNLAQISNESGKTKLAQEGLEHLSAGIRQSRKDFPCLFQQASGDMKGLMTNLRLWKSDAVAPAA
jgi:hypothetical protein